MIFTLDDIATYCPKLTGQITNADILAIQSIIESPLCANRGMDIVEYEDVKPLHRRLQFAHVTYMPLLSSPVPLIYTRNQDDVTTLGYSVNPPKSWQQLTTEQYEIDYRQGKIWVRSNFATHIKIVYSSGFNYSVQSSEIIKQKTAFGGILEWKLSAISQGIASQSVPSFYSISYASESTNQKTNTVGNRTSLDPTHEAFFDLFKQYRPRVF